MSQARDELAALARDLERVRRVPWEAAKAAPAMIARLLALLAEFDRRIAALEIPTLEKP